jgi:large subunit ribosomal protein L30
MAETGDRKVLRITLKRSEIGCTQRQRQTLYGLGLTRTGRSVLHVDSPALEGRIRKVLHLVEVSQHGS